MKAKLAGLRREIDNLVRTVDQGEAPESIVRRIAEEEKEEEEARSLVASR